MEAIVVAVIAAYSFFATTTLTIAGGRYSDYKKRLHKETVMKQAKPKSWSMNHG